MYWIIVLIVVLVNVHTSSSFRAQLMKKFSFGTKSFNNLKCVADGKANVDGSEREALIEKLKQNLKPGSTIVIKYGGHAMENEELQELFMDDIAALVTKLDIIPVIIHGGGPQIEQMLSKLKVESKFVNGLRVTDAATLEVVEMVLFKINKELAQKLSERLGVKGAVGLSGIDSGLIQAVQKDESLGYVGEPKSVNASLLHFIMDYKVVPIVSPIGSNIAQTRRWRKDIWSLNINADTAAGAVAEALKADKFLLLTDIAGVMNKEKVIMDTLSISDVPRMQEDGTLSDGMIPKVQTAVSALEAGVGAVSIIDGRVKHCVLRALSGEPFGTVVQK
jgi:acetylglutamate kinase